MRGLLGLGSKSTTWFIDQINQSYYEIHQGYSTCPFIMLNTDFNKLNPHLPDQFEKIIPVLHKYLDQLMELGATKILVPNFTLHESIIQLRKDYPITSIETLLQPWEKKIKEKPNLILGTSYTMTSNFLASQLQQANGEVIKLNSSDRNLIDELRTQIYYNGVKKNQIKFFNEFLANFEECNVFISCTELSTIPLNSKVFDFSKEMIADFVQST